MIKRALAVILAAVLSISLCACSVNFGGSKEYPLVLGHTQVDSQPADGSVIVLDDNVADVIIACGYVSKVMAVSDECTQKDYDGLTKVGTAAAPDAATITAMKPSLIFMTNDTSKDAKDAFKKAGIPTLTMASAGSALELETLYSSVSSALGGQITGYKKGLQTADDELNSIDSFYGKIPVNENVTKTVCFLFDLNGKASTDNTYGNFLIECAGGKNVLDGMTGDSIALTQLALLDPTYLVCPQGKAEEFKNNGILSTLSAVKKGKLIEMPAEYMYRQGSEISDAVEYLAKKLYPSMNNGETGEITESLADKYGIEIDGKTLEYGESGDDIRAMQQRLDDLGYLPIDPTGEFLDNTVTAMEEFKKYNGISPTDGKTADEETLKKLFSDSALERDTPIRAETPTLPQNETTEITEG